MTSFEAEAQTVLTELFRELPNTEIQLVKMIVDYLCTEEEITKDYSTIDKTDIYLTKYYTRFGIRQGLSTTYKFPENYLCTTEEYVNGKQHGFLKRYYSNGKIEMQMTLCQGKLTGTCNRWYSNGKLKSQEYYVNGHLEGERLWWYPNGVLNCQEHFVNGTVILENSKAWYKDGSVCTLYPIIYANVVL